MRNTLKMLGIICIIAATVFIAACGDLLDPTGGGYTVTFNSEGGTAVPSQTIEKDSGKVLNKPTDPTKTRLDAKKDGGLYKGTPTPVFKGWFNDDGTEYNFTNQAPITGSFTLSAHWGVSPEKINIPSTVTGTDIILKAINYIKAQNPGTTDKYTLAIGNDDLNNNNVVEGKGPIVLDTTNIDLTILGIGGQKEITPAFNVPTSTTNNAQVYLIVGKTTSDPSIKLTLNNVALRGRTAAVADSLVRVRNGASLTLASSSKIYGHTNNIGNNTSNGENGNGSAVCVVSGGILTIKEASVVENNKSIGTGQTNRNLVGGVYGYNGTIKIEGGQILNNECPSDIVDGEKVYTHTKDIYVIEDVELTISGDVKIGELTLNVDTSGSNTKNTVIKIPSSVTNDIDKLCLRSTEPPSNSNKSATQALTDTKDKWKGKVILQGTGGYTPSSADVAKFHLGEFRGTTSFKKLPNNSDQISDGFKIGTSGTDLGKLIDK